MIISYFFRYPSSFFSIEEQFHTIQNRLPEVVLFKNVVAKYPSRGVLKRVFICLQAAFNQCDINHITGDIHFIALLLNKRKTILTVHDIGSILNRSGFKIKIMRFFWFTMPFARVKYITVISEFTKQEILNRFKVDPNKILVIPNCVSELFIPEIKAFNTEKPVILHIGTTQNKNLHNLCAALENIPCNLHIVGRLSEEQNVLLQRFGINYENSYNLKQSEIVSLYQNCDLLTFVSIYEGFGVPILEAQATGRPVITSNIAPMKDVAGRGALLVDPNSVEEIRIGIMKLIQDKELRDKLVVAGLENVKKYSAKSVADQYFELYTKIIAKKNEMLCL